MRDRILEQVFKLIYLRISPELKKEIIKELEKFKTRACSKKRLSDNPFDDMLIDVLIEIMNEA